MQGYRGLWTYREPDGISNHARFWFHPDIARQYDAEAHVAEIMERDYIKALVTMENRTNP